MISSLIPTQGAVGFYQVTAKAQKLKKMNHREQKVYLAARPVPVVLDQKGRYYLVDRHHLCAACARTEIMKVYIILVANFSDTSSDAEFWARMQAAHYVLLHDAHGAVIKPEQLPRSIQFLPDDPYRSLAALVRNADAIQKIKIPFSEFAWADFFRKHIEHELVDDMLRCSNVTRAVKIARSQLAKNIPGFVGGQ